MPLEVQRHDKHVDHNYGPRTCDILWVSQKQKYNTESSSRDNVGRLTLTAICLEAN